MLTLPSVLKGFLRRAAREELPDAIADDDRVVDRSTLRRQFLQASVDSSAGIVQVRKVFSGQVLVCVVQAALSRQEYEVLDTRKAVNQRTRGARDVDESTEQMLRIRQVLEPGKRINCLRWQ